MHDITEFAMLSRITVGLPGNLALATEDFQEGCGFVRSCDVHWLDKEIRRRGWHFIWIAEPSLRSGVGETAQAAIAGAPKLALRRVNPGFNVANIDRIELIQYPWFFIAKVRVSPYQIQQNTVLKMTERAMHLPMTATSELEPVVGRLAAPIS